ncbi:zinc-dependent peptidase [Pontiella agarivorans]|uniref:Zinc-dependent peptidase n=1 Tax=Pontiella agarivorans TaxID=3038953 RepID=A0ABU5MZP2_9BACT|nr:M90 family metallopeptidase [Pontiella agarivorans]MDZ8119678.1 zinc-dependent peptidase [Pontiella agarivorans]
MIFSTLLLLLLIAATTLYLRHRSKQAKLHDLLTTPPPDHWRSTLQKTLPMVMRLSDAHWQELAGKMQVFLATKRFEGCGGLEVTDEMKMVISAQACMLLLGREVKVYPRLKTVLLYPHTYTDGETARLGESWQTGVVVLSWNSVTGGARNFQDGHNVTFHEFAHQLDQESGAADGAPILGDNAYQTWARVFSMEFEDLVEKTDQGLRDVMDEYGATNPAEFFAVATETFFEKPRQMKHVHPELFDKLRNYYKVDPTEWI